jgi:hypothetical protein
MVEASRKSWAAEAVLESGQEVAVVETLPHKTTTQQGLEELVRSSEDSVALPGSEVLGRTLHMEEHLTTLGYLRE